MKRTSNLREIRESSDDELRARVARVEEELFGHKMKRYTNQLDNTMKIRQARREIARVKTILTNRGRAVESRTATAAKTEE